MPTINIQLFEGRTVEQKRELAKAITEATCKTCTVSIARNGATAV